MTGELRSEEPLAQLGCRLGAEAGLQAVLSGPSPSVPLVHVSRVSVSMNRDMNHAGYAHSVTLGQTWPPCGF